MRRLAYAVLVLLFIASFIAGWERLFAHADLIRAGPPLDSRLRSAPDQLDRFLSQGLKREGSFVHVEDAECERLDVQVAFDDSDAKVMRASVSGMTDPGAYRVRWQTKRADDDDYHHSSYQLVLLNSDGSLPSGLQTAATGEEGGDATAIAVVVGAVVLLLFLALAVFPRATARRTR
jgi:methionine-rich copper-binding protein CopC